MRYSGYGQLLRCVAETPIKLLGADQSGETDLAARRGETLAVRSLQLTGLPTAAGQKFFKARGDFWASESVESLD